MFMFECFPLVTLRFGHRNNDHVRPCETRGALVRVWFVPKLDLAGPPGTARSGDSAGIDPVPG